MQYAIGSVVATPLGEGTIVKYDAAAKLYTVRVGEKEAEMPRGDLLIQPASESPNECPSEEEKPEVKEEVEKEVEKEEVEKVEKEKEKEKEEVKEEKMEEEKPETEETEETPIQVEVDEPAIPATRDVVFGGNNLYVFYRLYQLIYTRLQQCFTLCQTDLYTESNMTAHAVERALGEKKEEGSASPTAVDRNVELMDAMIHLLRGELTNQGFEQKCRQVLGTSGYFLYTIDRVVTGCLRQIQNMMSDAMNVQLIVGAGRAGEA